MARIEGMKVQLSCTGVEAAEASLESLAAVLDPAGPKVEAEHLLAEFIAAVCDGADDGDHICRFETLANATGGTLELVSIKVLPGELFLELVTAIARERDDVSLTLRHGWPILSVGRVAAPTVAEAGGESIAPGGGAA